MDFLNVMLKIWMKYWSLFLQGLGMTLFMGLLTVLISTVFGSLMALMRRSNVGIGKFKPLRLIAMTQDRESLLRQLQRAGCVEISEPETGQLDQGWEGLTRPVMR